MLRLWHYLRLRSYQDLTARWWTIGYVFVWCLFIHVLKPYIAIFFTWKACFIFCFLELIPACVLAGSHHFLCWHSHPIWSWYGIWSYGNASRRKEASNGRYLLLSMASSCSGAGIPLLSYIKITFLCHVNIVINKFSLAVWIVWCVWWTWWRGGSNNCKRVCSWSNIDVLNLNLVAYLENAYLISDCLIFQNTS